MNILILKTTSEGSSAKY